MLLDLKNLYVEFDTDDGIVEAVRGISLNLKKGEILAIVGESGSGKSVACKSITGLLCNKARVSSDGIYVNGIDISGFNEKEMRSVRGKVISMIFQDPLSSLNPGMSVGKQIREAILRDKKISKREAYIKTLELMNLVGISEAKARYNQQPYFFSGGQRQRIALAIALALNPKILIADEPTTALDITTQKKILDLLKEIRDKIGLSIIFVSHDLSVVSRIADRVAVMYAGKIVEIGTAEEIFKFSEHPYTKGLLASIPSIAKRGEELSCIPGMPMTLLNPPKGDAFAERNKDALLIDYMKNPPFYKLSSTHYVASWELFKKLWSELK